MALDLHRTDTKTFIFSLDEKTFHSLHPVFKAFYKKTGLQFDLYKDLQLSVGFQKTLIQLLNENLFEDSQIIQFKNILEKLTNEGINLSFYAD
jgi:hypothetical protein